MSTSQISGFNSRYHRLDASQTLSPAQLVNTKDDYDFDTSGAIRSIATASAATTSIPAFGKRDFFACFEVKPAAATNEIMLMDGLGACLFRIDVSNVVTVYSRAGSYYLGSSTATYARHKYSVFSYERTNGVGKVYLNGELILTTVDNEDYGSNGLNLLSECWGNLQYTFVGDVKRMLILNAVPTDAERAIIHAGGLPERLAQRGISDTYNTWIEQADVNNLLTVSGNTFTKLAGDSPGYLSCMASLLPHRFEFVRPNDTIRFTYVCNLISGSASDLPYLIFGEYNTLVGWIGQVQPGRHTIEYKLPPEISLSQQYQYLSINWSTGYGIPTGATSFTVDLEEITRIGTVARFEKKTATVSGRWGDTSGNNYHFCPTAGMIGINAKQPHICVYDASLSDNIIPANSDAELTLVVTRGNSIRAGDCLSAHIIDLPSGLLCKNTKCAADNVVTVVIHNLNNTDTATGLRGVKLTHTID